MSVNLYIPTTYQLRPPTLLSAQIDQAASIGHTIFSQTFQAPNREGRNAGRIVPRGQKLGSTDSSLNG